MHTGVKYIIPFYNHPWEWRQWAIRVALKIPISL